MIKFAEKNFTYLFTVFLGFALLLFLAPAATYAQEESDATKEKAPQTNTSTQQETTAINKSAKPAGDILKPKLEPVYRDYKGIHIGMKNDDVRDKLSKLKDKGETQDFFVISDKEMAQVFYDGDGTVRAISVTYTGKLENAPTPMSVFGEDLAAKEDGSIFKMTQYPDAGYWISYNRTGGDNAIVTVTMQKM